MAEMMQSDWERLTAALVVKYVNNIDDGLTPEERLRFIIGGVVADTWLWTQGTDITALADVHWDPKSLLPQWYLKELDG